MKRLYLLMSLLLWAMSCLGNQIQPIIQLDISNGLSHNGVTSMIEDSRGYIWIGTYDGLNIYDGKRVRIYKNTVNQNFFKSNRVRSLCEDDAGRIWVGTDKGITILDYMRHSFEHLELPDSLRDVTANLIINNIFFDQTKGLMYCFSDNGKAYIYDKTDRLQGVDDLQAYFQKVKLNDILMMKDHFLMATSVGIVDYWPSDSVRFAKDASFNGFCDALERADDQTIIAAMRPQIMTLSLAYKKGERTPRFTQISKFTPEENIMYETIKIDNEQNLWLGTVSNGCYRYGEDRDKKHRKTTEVFRSSGFLNASNHTCWVHTYDKGAYCYPTRETPFRMIESKTGKRLFNAYAMDSVRIIYVDDNTLRVYDTERQCEEVAPMHGWDTKLYGATKNICHSKQQATTWMIARVDRHLTMYQIDRYGVCHHEMKAQIGDGMMTMASVFKEDWEGNIWVAYENKIFMCGTNGVGGIKYSFPLHEIDGLREHELGPIRDVYHDEETRQVFVCTERSGLYVLNGLDKGSDGVRVENYRHQKGVEGSISSDFVSTIVRDLNGELWLGTEGGGICRVDVEDDGKLKFESYTESEGLANNAVKSIVCDAPNSLWITTNIGLSNFNTRTKMFRTYHRNDGMGIDGFTYHGGRMGTDKLIFMGCNAIMYFEPSNIMVDHTMPPLQFGELRINNRTIVPNEAVEGRVLMKRQLQDGDSILLKHNQNFFSIEIESLHYGDMTSHLIRYKLLPTNQKWIVKTCEQSTIDFNALQAGDYTLVAEVSNLYGEWSESKSLYISITPIFWKSSWAYGMYGVIFIGITLLVMFYLIRLAKLKHSLELESMEKNFLKTTNEEKHRFFTNISHELKTPLTIMNAPLMYLSEHKFQEQAINEKVNLMERQARKLNMLIDTALHIQLDEYNLLEPKPRIFSMSKLMKDTIYDFSFVATQDEKELALEMEDEGAIYVSADLEMVEKIVNNIVNNAFKYTRKGDKIRMKVEVEGADLLLSISDTGRGISEYDKPRVFERYYHGGDANAPSGTGIGLSFCKRLVELHGGTIEVDSQIEVGTTFFVRLPIVVDDESEERENHAHEVELVKGNLLMDSIDGPAYVGKHDLKNSLVYLVEDDAEVRAILLEILRQHYRVESFSNGLECLNELKNCWPDIIVSDVMMPGMNGLELCKAIKSDIKTSHIPVILLTACSTVDDRILGLESGADAYIPKPFYPKHLIVRIEMLLVNRKQLRERYQIGMPITFDASRITAAKDNEFLDLFYKYIAEHIDDEIDVNVLAVSIGLNRTYLYKKIKALTDMTPAEFIKEYRLIKAAELIQTQQYSIDEICEMTGFKSRTNFSKLFKERFGVSPGKYITQNSNV